MKYQWHKTVIKFVMYVYICLNIILSVATMILHDIRMFSALHYWWCHSNVGHRFQLVRCGGFHWRLVVAAVLPAV